MHDSADVVHQANIQEEGLNLFPWTPAWSEAGTGGVVHRLNIPARISNSAERRMAGDFPGINMEA